ncbi:murein hydrolase activator EnvC family protein [Rhodopila sp.]|uniref:murein hydrolase activator EnvC family protein n=1 Tax=Rhodopila sp. TaxID=2480087 RepID=UPI002CDA7864|nr:peptidoglycan DD-metalloendopeptidase family protein [Rhodopila sp.]HVZ10504.1 peptidoglycan DD-metalloendopeptidase family protein [Rhodopila sp.]
MILLLLGVHAAQPVRAASKREEEAQRRLQAAEQARQQQAQRGKEASARAAQAANEVARLGQQRAQAAAKLQQADAALQAVAERIDALSAKRREAERRLNERAASLRPLLPLIERLSLYPMETLLAVPENPENALRGLLVLKGLSRRIEIEAEALARDQADLDQAVAALHAEAPRLAEAQAAQTRQAATLDAQIAASRAAQDKAEAEARAAAVQAAQAAAKADSLKSVLAAIQAEERAAAAKAKAEAERAEREKRLAEAQAAREREATAAAPAGPAATMTTGGGGRLQPPVVGVVVRTWGQATDGGPATGISYQAPPGARVVAPCGGRVVFADTFRSYGLLMIVDCGGGYHIVLSGFDRLDVRLGQSVVAGDPVGVMPSWEPGAAERRPTLYVEVRRGSQPVNPAPLLRTSG